MAQAKVTGLGHVGLFITDPDVMIEFYRDFLGMTLTDKADNNSIIFFSTHPETEHHELALVHKPGVSSNVQQVSFIVDSLADLKEFWERIKQRQYHVNMVISHGNAFGCYFNDPEGNNVEVYWKTDKDIPQPHGDRLDLDLSIDELQHILDTMPEEKRPAA